MRNYVDMVLFSVAVAGLALPVSGQVSRGRTTTVEMTHPHVARLPYTADYKITSVKTLADGTTITHESTEVVAVDSQGRRMTSTTTLPNSADQSPRTHVTVFDPVAHTNTNWSVPGRQVTVMNMPAPGAARAGCGANISGQVAPVSGMQFTRPVMEDLGTETINGVEAHGHRMTTTTPAGAVGNDAPLVRINENWTAVVPGLNGLLVRSVNDDPQIGKTDKELTNLEQAEPDASVFQPPAEYEIVNKDAPVPTCANAAGAEQPMAPILPPPPPEQ